MSANICSVCSNKMVKNGKTKAGKQRYRCLECGSSQSRYIWKHCSMVEQHHSDSYPYITE